MLSISADMRSTDDAIAFEGIIGGATVHAVTNNSTAVSSKGAYCTVLHGTYTRSSFQISAAPHPPYFYILYLFDSVECIVTNSVLLRMDDTMQIG